jgi:hypothetical protein
VKYFPKEAGQFGTIGISSIMIVLYDDRSRDKLLVLLE